MTAVKPILEARGLMKRYGTVVAMNGADFDLMPGEICAVIGDNGAGKSTLIKALSGAVSPDHGEILLDGKPVNFRSPDDARAMGIETVYQNLAMSPALSIADNMFLGREWRKPGIMGQVFRQMDRPRMEAFARQKLSELGLMTIQDISQAVETLSGGQRQGRGPRRRLWVKGGDLGRTDRRLGREGIPSRAGTDPRCARPRHSDHPYQPQHAACVRSGRPHPHPPPWPSPVRDPPAGLFDV